MEPPLSSELSGWSVPGVASHWYIDDSIDATLRNMLLESDQDRSRYFFHDLWYGDVDDLLHGALLNALLWNQSHDFTVISSMTWPFCHKKPTEFCFCLCTVIELIVVCR